MHLVEIRSLHEKIRGRMTQEKRKESIGYVMRSEILRRVEKRSVFRRGLDIARRNSYRNYRRNLESFNERLRNETASRYAANSKEY